MRRIFALLLILSLFPLIACSTSTPSATRPFPPPEGFSSWEEYNQANAKTTVIPVPSSSTTSKTNDYARYDVVYEITGTASEVNVTLSNATGGIEQYGSVSLPKTYRYYDFSGWFMSILAQNLGEYGSVNVAIYVKGKLVDSAHSSGAYVIASASYSPLE